MARADVCRCLPVPCARALPYTLCRAIQAVRAATLLLPESFTEHDLYTQICQLSYMGDFRMVRCLLPLTISSIERCRVRPSAASCLRSVWPGAGSPPHVLMATPH